MVEDMNGFLIPNIDFTKCIDCGRCNRFCPANNAKDLKNITKGQKYYLVWHRSDEVRYNSSSGGAFTALAETVLENSGVVVGAAYNDNFTVAHKAVYDINGLEDLRKSKYLQSNTVGVYKLIDGLLKEDRTVLFCGTPCQCGALKSIFKNSERLILCDLICHGVQSPKFFLDALSYMEKKSKSKCVFVDFRSKTKGWANACTALVKFENGQTINKRANDIPIGAGFLNNLSIRECCEDCQYRSMERSGDITIGDFWAIRDSPPI